jgi:hypothetical protein
MLKSRFANAPAAVALLAVGVAVGSLVPHTPRLRTATFDPPYPEHNAAGDAILAVHEGRVPCSVSACERLKVQLVLYSRAPGSPPTSYWLGIVGAQGNDRVMSSGGVRTGSGVASYPEAVVYTLDQPSGTGLEFNSLWRVSDDILLPLDAQLRPRPGNGAWGTMLSRYTGTYGPRRYEWWG